MTESSPAILNSPDTLPNAPRTRTMIVAVLLLIAIGIGLVQFLTQHEQTREQRNWQDKLNQVVENRSAALEGYVADHFSQLKKLAENPSLQIYLSEMNTYNTQETLPNARDVAEGMENTDAIAEEGVSLSASPQTMYLRNLLIFTADRMGFLASIQTATADLPAQVPQTSQTGLAILGPDMALRVSTPYFDALSPPVRAVLQTLPEISAGIVDLHRGNDGKTYLGFVVPVFGIQADPAVASPIGRIVGIKEVSSAIADLLKPPGITEKTLEVMLVRRDKGNVQYLSTLHDDTAPFLKQLQDTPDTLAASFALAEPGAFAERTDYQGKTVLVTGRAIAGTNWTVVAKINRSEALANSENRQRTLMIIVALTVGMLVAVVVAMWRAASSRRAWLSSRYFRELADKTAAQEKLLRVVSDHQPETLYIVDQEQRFHFVNTPAARQLGMSGDALLGKTMADVMGTARCAEMSPLVRRTIAQQQTCSQTLHGTSEDGVEHVKQVSYVPLSQIPIADLLDPTPGALIVEQDVTKLVRERERRIRAHRQMLDTVLALVDQRDPHAANHSALVGALSREVATAIDLSPQLRDTAELAGILMNIGKIIVPETVLTKPAALEEKEKRAIRESLFESVNLLKNIEFEGPVVATLEQSQEWWSGSGPLQLKGENILPTARIITVINAFVSMISPRAYRDAMPENKALEMLRLQIEQQFDRSIVVALEHCLTNQEGRAIVARYMEKAAA